MDKKVLVLCTKNSCRSIIAEAIINKYLDGVKAYSSGVDAGQKVNPNAKKVLKDFDCWSDDYHSKTIDKVMQIDFDLVVTVCDSAKENCPVFPKDTKILHIGFSDPDGLGFDAFVKTFYDIKNILLPKIDETISQLGLSATK